MAKHAEKRQRQDMTAVHAAPTSGPTFPNSILAGGSSSANEAIIVRPQDGPISHHRHSDESQLDFAFLSDEEVWADIFTSAGFSIQDGVFFA